MANIIESFLLEIAIDPAGVKKGADEVSIIHKKTTAESIQIAKEMEERGKQAGGFFKSLKEEAGGFFAMMASAYSAQKIASMTKDIMLNSESVGYLAQNLGMTTERLSAWGMAAEKNGGSAAAMTAQLQAAAFAVAETVRGRSFPGMEAFLSMGGTISDLKSVEGYLTAISKILENEKDPVKRTNLANWMQVNPGAFNLLQQGPATVQALVKAQEEYASVSKKQAEAFHETLNYSRDIGNSLTVVGGVLVETINPSLKEMAALLKEISDYFTKNRDSIKEGVQKWIIKPLQNLPGAIPASRFTKEEPIKPSALVPNAGGKATQEQKDKLRETEKKWGLPAGIADAVWLQESSRGKNMLSPKGAMGHFGFMPDTWKAFGKGDPNNFDDSRDAFGNYMNALLIQHHGDKDAALRWYNAGTNYNGLQAHKYADEVQGNMQAGSTNTTSTQINVNGPINIQSQTDNPDRLAGDLVQKLQSYSTISSQADTGTH